MKSSRNLLLWFLIVGLVQTNRYGVFALSSSNEHLPTPMLQTTTDPPLLDVPTYSLATQDENGQTGMNILTYASPISIRPDRIWSIGLFKGTWTHEHFARTGKGVLQLLAPHHAKVVRLLGGSSTREVNKKEKCADLDVPWIPFPENEDEKSSIQVLPSCVHYLKVRLVGALIDCGSHDLAMCKVEAMFVSPSAEDGDGDSANKKQPLMTSQLREMGIITAQGRVADE